MSASAPVDRGAHRAVRCWLPRGLCVYFVLGLLAAPTRGHEVFPFFSWFLFPLTPAVETRFQVQLQEIGGVSVPTSPAFQVAHGWVEARSVDAQFVIQRLGSAVETGDTDASEAARHLFEAHFLEAPCRYSLVKRRYDPLRSLAGEGDVEQRRLASFRCGVVGGGASP